MARLPAKVHAASHVETVVVTPFHHRVEKMRALPRNLVGSFGVPAEGHSRQVHVYRHDDQVPYYFLLPDDRDCFAGTRHPYDVQGDRLLRDALFFGSAVLRALHVISPGQRWTLLLQDWEAATAVLAAAGAPGRPRAFVTLHNSYDCNVSDDLLSSVGINPEACPGYTVLQRALALTDLPVFTVSDQFAHDLTEDVLQTAVLAPQLQHTLGARLVGIDNGPFVDLAVDPQALADAESGNTAPLAQWKSRNRRAFLEALTTLKAGEDRPLWGDPSRFVGDESAWFVMAGRDDSRQKGYDVAAAAASAFLERGGKGRFLFFPIPGDEGRPGLGFLRRLAERFPASVLVFPFLFREGFLGGLRGATFGVMPSLYEPFGMAHEFYLNGTVGIGRATGGIVQQIAPLRAAGSFGRSVAQRAGRWHPVSANPTGLLFREKDGLPNEVEDWQALNAAGYSIDGNPDRVEERSRYGLFQSMTAELSTALADAVALFENEPAQYYRMLAAGISHVRQNFSWNRAALEYVRHVAQ